VPNRSLRVLVALLLTSLAVRYAFVLCARVTTGEWFPASFAFVGQRGVAFALYVAARLLFLLALLSPVAAAVELIRGSLTNRCASWQSALGFLVGWFAWLAAIVFDGFGSVLWLLD
jgi:hypothetical protein